MKVEELQKKIRCGETSRVRFKQQFTSQKQFQDVKLGDIVWKK